MGQVEAGVVPHVTLQTTHASLELELCVVCTPGQKSVEGGEELTGSSGVWKRKVSK